MNTAPSSIPTHEEQTKRQQEARRKAVERSLRFEIRSRARKLGFTFEELDQLCQRYPGIRAIIGNRRRFTATQFKLIEDFRVSLRRREAETKKPDTENQDTSP